MAPFDRKPALAFRPSMSHRGTAARLKRRLATAYKAQRQNSATFRDLWNRLPVMLHMIDAKGILLDVNKNWLEVLGYQREEVIGRPSVDFLTEESRKKVLERDFPRLLKHGVNRGLFLQMVAKDGRLIDVALWANQEKLPTGEVKNSLAVIEDLTNAKEAMAELNYYQRLLASAVDSLDGLFMVVDRNFRVVFSNWKGHDYIDTDQRRPGAFCHQVFKHRQQPCAICLPMETFQDGNFRIYEEKNPIDGTYREVRVNPIKDDQGRVVMVVEYVLDVTSRKLAEQERKQLAVIIERLDALVAMGTPQGKLTYMNRSGRGLLGWSLDMPIAQMRIQDIHPSWAYDLVQAQGIPTAIENGHWQGETAVMRPDGSQAPVNQVIMSHRSEPEGETFLSTIMRDLTHDREVEQQLKLTQFAVEHASDGFLLIDEDGRLVYTNQTVREMLGYTREELQDLTVFDIDPDINIENRTTMWDKLRTKGSAVIHSHHRTKDGRIFPVEVHGNYLNYRGKVYDCVFVRDISQRLAINEEKAKLENQLQQSQKMEAIGNLASGIAHDFNNLLQIINGYTQLLNQPDLSLAKKSEFIGEVSATVEKGAELVRQLLTLGRKYERNLQHLDLNREVMNCVRVLSRTLPKMIELKTDLSPDLPAIDADAVQINQILMNLASNADYAMRGSGELAFSTKSFQADEGFCLLHPNLKTGRYALLTVSDTGEGMSRETLDHIFEPFFTTKAPGKGTGLGLATVYGIMRGHGGWINCVSEPGMGTRFNLFFPASSEELTITQDQSPELEDLPGGHESVMLVDDEAGIVDFGQAILQAYGYKVLTASSGEEALQSLDQASVPVDLVILDLGMPGMGGETCLERLLKSHPECRVIVSSGYTEEGQVHRILKKGASRFIPKPYGLRRLLAEVRQVLDLPD